MGVGGGKNESWLRVSFFGWLCSCGVSGYMVDFSLGGLGRSLALVRCCENVVVGMEESGLSIL